MFRELTSRESETARLMIRHATTSPDADDYATFTAEQKRGWDRPIPITGDRRTTWEDNLGEVVVTHSCDCGACPTIGMRPITRAEDERRDDRGGSGDFAERIALTAGVDGAMLLLFIDDDSPSCLELAPLDEAVVFEEFPSGDHITF